MKRNFETEKIFIMVMLISCIEMYIFIGIYIYSISAQQEFQITSDQSSQSSPTIYGDTVVWTDFRNGDANIYGYNLSTQQEFQITSDKSDQWWPVIYGDTVVWTDFRNGDANIYGYNLSTQQEFQITSDKSDQYLPAIFHEKPHR